MDSHRDLLIKFLAYLRLNNSTPPINGKDLSLTAGLVKFDRKEAKELVDLEKKAKEYIDELYRIDQAKYGK
jgi:hypothetical protein